MEGISQNLQILNAYEPGPPTEFLFLRMIVKQVKSSSKTNRYQRVNRHKAIYINESILSSQSVENISP